MLFVQLFSLFIVLYHFESYGASSFSHFGALLMHLPEGIPSELLHKRRRIRKVPFLQISFVQLAIFSRLFQYFGEVWRAHTISHVVVT